MKHMTTQQRRQINIGTAARHRVGYDERYTSALTELCVELRCVVANSWISPACVRRLDKRNHRCSHDYDREGLGIHEVDHPLWLRWPDGQWGLLSQTYGDWTDKVQAKRPDLTCIHLGLAPYGHGTTATLIIGADGPPVARSGWWPLS